LAGGSLSGLRGWSQDAGSVGRGEAQGHGEHEGEVECYEASERSDDGGSGEHAQVAEAGGLTAYDLPDAAVKRAAIASARRTIVVTDGSKFTRTALATVAPASSLDAVVTDETAPAAQLEALAAAGTTVWQV
jgi:DeoR C terminal sensor domain